MGETTQGRTGKWAKRLGGGTTRGERESGRNDSGANGKVGETTRVLLNDTYAETELNVLIEDTYYKIPVTSIGRATFFIYKTQGRRFKNVNRKVQGVPLQEATANPWHQEEEKKDKKK